MRIVFYGMIFVLFMLGVAYIGYIDVVLKGRISQFDRFAILTLTVLGLYFVISKFVLSLPWITKNFRHFRRGGEK